MCRQTVALSRHKALANKGLKIGFDAGGIDTEKCRQVFGRRSCRQSCDPEDEPLTPGHAESFRHVFRRMLQGSAKLPDEPEELQRLGQARKLGRTRLWIHFVWKSAMRETDWAPIKRRLKRFGLDTALLQGPETPKDGGPTIQEFLRLTAAAPFRRGPSITVSAAFPGCAGRGSTHMVRDRRRTPFRPRRRGGVRHSRGSPRVQPLHHRGRVSVSAHR